jgi:Holliday junction resolvase RusA-like endonuclease
MDGSYTVERRGEIKKIVLKFPGAPPSTNNLYIARKDGKGRARTSQYKAWQLEAQQIVMISGCPREGWKHVRVEVRAPVNYQRDIDNTLKPTLDVLTTMGVIHDDCWIDQLEVRRVPVTEALVVSVCRLS